MATRNIVPRGNNEGSLGTTTKKWAAAHIDQIYGNVVNLDNVDNTSDEDKPVSTAQATAIANAVSGAIAQTVTDGETNSSPSQDAVFDALSAKTLGLLNIASLPAHYERSDKWAKGTTRTTIAAPSRLTVNVNDIGYLLNDKAQIDINTAGNWDSTATDYTVAANRAGKDFYIYACTPVSGIAPVIVLSANSTVPTGYLATTSRKIGGFHCLCVAVGTISGHPLTGYLAGDILPLSIWDLKHRPISNPEGMVYIDRINAWVDIYLQSGTGTSTASVRGATITDTRMWNDHVDDLGAVKKRLLDDSEFQIAAEGSNQTTNISGSADPVTTNGHVDTAGRRMISNFGLEDCCGALWQWLTDQSYQPGSGVAGFKDVVGTTKGQLYLMADNADVKLLAGGNWTNGAGCGSRARVAANYRWSASASLAGRGRAEPA